MAFLPSSYVCHIIISSYLFLPLPSWNYVAYTPASIVSILPESFLPTLPIIPSFILLSCVTFYYEAGRHFPPLQYPSLSPFQSTRNCLQSPLSPVISYVPMPQAGYVYFSNPYLQETDIIGLMFSLVVVPRIYCCWIILHAAVPAVPVFLTLTSFLWCVYAIVLVQNPSYLFFRISSVAVPSAPCICHLCLFFSVSVVPAAPHICHHTCPLPSPPLTFYFIPIVINPCYRHFFHTESLLNSSSNFLYYPVPLNLVCLHIPVSLLCLFFQSFYHFRISNAVIIVKTSISSATVIFPCVYDSTRI